jgi:hypothetical protein
MMAARADRVLESTDFGAGLGYVHTNAKKLVNFPAKPPAGVHLPVNKGDLRGN